MAEGKIFNCPSCGSSLSPEGNQSEIKCPYCGNTVIVPPELREHASSGKSINIIIGESGASVQMPDYSASSPIRVTMNEQPIDISNLTQNTLASDSTKRWVRIGVWVFVAFIILTVVVPLACSLLGIAAAFVPFFIR